MAIENDKHLLQLTELDRMLAVTTRIDEITDIRAKVEALRVYAVNIGASRQECKLFAMSRLKAERKAGQVLLSLPRLNGARPEDADFHESSPQVLDGVSDTQSHRWQMIARLPDDKFDKLMLGRVQSSDEITTAFFYKAGRIHAGYTDQRPNRLSIPIDNPALAAQLIRCKLTPGNVAELIRWLQERE